MQTRSKLKKTLDVILGFIVATVLGLMFLAITAGCSSGSRGPRYSFPPQYSAEFHGQLNWARGVVRDVGVHKVRDRSLTVTLVTGQKKIGDTWCWKVSYPGLPPNLWVAGLYFDWGRMEIGQAPGGGQVHWGTVGHEMVHHILFAVGERGHHPAYDRHVHNWANSRRVVGFSGDEGGAVDILVEDPRGLVVRISGFLDGDPDAEPMGAGIPLFPVDRR